MAKNRNKKKNKTNGAVSMEISSENTRDTPQAMDTSEGKPSNPALSAINRKIKKGIPVKRSKNARKLKAIERAISISEKSEEKVSKHKTKMLKIQSAKTLYD